MKAKFERHWHAGLPPGEGGREVVTGPNGPWGLSWSHNSLITHLPQHSLLLLPAFFPGGLSTSSLPMPFQDTSVSCISHFLHSIKYLDLLESGTSRTDDPKAGCEVLAVQARKSELYCPNSCYKPQKLCIAEHTCNLSTVEAETDRQIPGAPWLASPQQVTDTGSKNKVGGTWRMVPEAVLWPSHATHKPANT